MVDMPKRLWKCAISEVKSLCGGRLRKIIRKVVIVLVTVLLLAIAIVMAQATSAQGPCPANVGGRWKGLLLRQRVAPVAVSAAGGVEP